MTYHIITKIIGTYRQVLEVAASAGGLTGQAGAQQ